MNDLINMKAKFSKVEFPDWDIEDRVDGILYRWATKEDIPNITDTTDDDFDKIYEDESIYSKTKVLIALDKEIVCGAIIVDKKGSTVSNLYVKTDYRRNHIGTNLSIIANRYLKKEGIKEGIIKDVHPGLEKLFSYSGYKKED